MHRRGPAFLVLLIALAACSGGGGSSLPRIAPGPISSSAPTTTQSVKVAIRVPATVSTSGAARRPAYVSTQTQSAAIVVNGGAPSIVDLAPNAPGCTTSSTGRTCSISVSAPSGTDTFVVHLFASINGTGEALSQGVTTSVITPGTNNTVNLTLDGVPASVTLVLSNPTPPENTSTQITLTATIADASGAAIIGSDPLLYPITLTDSDASQATSLSTTTLNTPADAANLYVNYSGAPLSSPAVFSATSAGFNSSAVTTASLTPKGSGGTTAAGFNDYTTFGYDNEHDVFNPNSANLSPTNLSKLHLAWQSVLGNGEYSSQTQPILATEIPGHSGVLFVGGGSGTEYGYDATTGKFIWKNSNLGHLTYTCATGVIDFGIGGTAAYDPSSRSIYVVANANSQLNANSSNVLYHLDGSTGSILGSADFSPGNVGPTELNFGHTAVTLGANGLAYVGTGGTCDKSSWRGRIAAVSVPSMQLAQTFFPVWNGTTEPWGGGGIWGWGGVSLDSAGNVYSGTGNTDNGSSEYGTISPPFVASPTEYSGYGETFLKLSPGLSTVEDSVHPIPHSSYSIAEDLDINGTSVLFTPNGTGCPAMAALQGKGGALMFFDTGAIGAGPVATFQLAPPTYADQFIGSPSYSPVTGLLYEAVPLNDGVYPPGMIAIDPGCGSPHIVWHHQFGPDSNANGDGYSRSVPAASAGGLVFVATPCAADGSGGCTGNLTPNAAARSAQSAVRRPLICCNPPGSSTMGGAVWVLDAVTGDVLNGGLPLFTTPGVIRMPPTIDGDWVFVLDNSGNMYGLTIDSAYPSIQSKQHALDTRSQYKWENQPRKVQN